jgi:hypothetical protein
MRAADISKNSKCSAVEAPNWDSYIPSSTNFRQKRLCMSSLESQYGDKTGVEESLIAQIDSQSKLATLRRENRKNLTRKLNLKSK